MNGQRDSDGCFGLVALVIVGIMVFVAVVWFVSLVGHALSLTPTYPEIDRHDGAWVRAHYENVGLGYVLTVLTLVAGIPLSIALTLELWRDRPRVESALKLAAPLVALVSAVALMPAGPVR